ncbi:MAG TPA: hypothetical protein VG839_09965 [Asticcacaulis sp.]|nr:hypothetical protein [Asticcacaulis sp.]
MQLPLTRTYGHGRFLRLLLIGLGLLGIAAVVARSGLYDLALPVLNSGEILAFVIVPSLLLLGLGLFGARVVFTVDTTGLTRRGEGFFDRRSQRIGMDRIAKVRLSEIRATDSSYRVQVVIILKSGRKPVFSVGSDLDDAVAVKQAIEEAISAS